MTDPLDHAFNVVVQAAVNGLRCPENGTNGMHMQAISRLAHAGRIEIEIYAHNYRRVTIMEGEHKGKSTAPHPTGLRPWKTINKDGTHTRAGTTTPGKRNEPWKPGQPKPIAYAGK